MNATRIVWLLVLLAACSPQRPAAPPDPDALGNGLFRLVPRSARVEKQKPYALTLYTHCGLERSVPDFDGSLWRYLASPASAGSGATAPRGFSDPTDDGTMTLVAGDEAVFVSSGGVTARFRRASGPVIVKGCY